MHAMWRFHILQITNLLLLYVVVCLFSVPYFNRFLPTHITYYMQQCTLIKAPVFIKFFIHYKCRIVSARNIDFTRRRLKRTNQRCARIFFLARLITLWLDWLLCALVGLIYIYRYVNLLIANKLQTTFVDVIYESSHGE